MILAVLAVASALSVIAPAPAAAARRAAPVALSADAKLAFVPDAGRSGGSSRFVAHATTGDIILAPGGIALAPRGDRRERRLAVVFNGSNPAASIEGSLPLATTVNWLVGSDASRWRHNLPTYARVTYHDLWAGVDLDVTGQGGALKGTYIVAPGRDPAAIRWSYAGARSLRLEPSGALAVGAGAGVLSETAPVAWQGAGDSRRPVDVAFAVREDGEVGFSVGPYDASLPLVIDPTLVYSTLIGGSDFDEGRDIAVDAYGNVYITGTTRSPDLPGAGAPDPTYGGPASASSFGDAFIAKLNAAGDGLVYLTYLGGSGEDVADAIAVDADGNAYVTGMTRSSDFPTVNAVQATAGGQACSSPPCSDAFVVKLNAAGNALTFSTYLGGDKNENSGLLDLGSRSTALGIAVDDDRNVYVTGVTESDNFPVANGAFSTRSGAADVFVTKLRSDGKTILYSTYLGGEGTEYSGDIAVDAFGRAYVTGTTLSSSFPVKGGVQAANRGFADVFVAELDTFAAGTASLVYSTYLGGADGDYGMAIAIDAAGSATVAGHTQSLDFPTRNGFQTGKGGAPEASSRDAFVVKLSPTGDQLTYGTYLGGADNDLAYAMKLNDRGEVFVAGRTYSNDFPAVDAWQSHNGGSSDVFVARIDPSKSGAASLVYSTYLGGTASDYAYGVAVDAGDDAYVVGSTGGSSTDSFPIWASLGPNGAGAGILVAKLDPRSQYWIPVASHGAGAKGSQWRTDLGAQDGSAGAATLSLRLASGASTYSTGTVIPQGNQAILTDVVGQLGFTGNGAIEVLSDRPVRLSSRTYNAIAADAPCYAGGTFGQNYDVEVATAGLKSGETAWLAQLVQTSAYRTNIIVTNTGRRPATVTVSLYDGAGQFLTSYQTTVAAGEMKLDNQPLLNRAHKSNLQRAYARVWVTTGFGVVASASVVDNLTNDPTTIAMLRADAQVTLAWLPVASHGAGAKGSQWRTDLGVMNPSTLAANVTLRFHTGSAVYSNSAQVAPASQAIFTDVVGSIPASGNGTLEVASDRGVIVTSRTYNQISSTAPCFPRGTLGQSYAAYDPSAGLAAGQVAWLVQLVETTAYRTNISLSNLGASPASVTVTLFDAGGASLASYTVPLAPGEMKQENRPFFTKAGKSALAAGYARVSVDSGSGVVALASVIDNVTNDPTTIAPLR